VAPAPGFEPGTK